MLTLDINKNNYSITGSMDDPKKIKAWKRTMSQGRCNYENY